MLALEEIRQERAEALETVKACLFYFRAQGLTAWEIARKLTKSLTPGQMRVTSATLFDIDELKVAEEVAKLADRAEREAERKKEVAEAVRRKRERVDTYYICDVDGVVLEIVENSSYAFAESRCIDLMGRFGGLEVLNEEEYDEEYGEEA